MLSFTNICHIEDHEMCLHSIPENMAVAYEICMLKKETLSMCLYSIQACFLSFQTCRYIYKWKPFTCTVPSKKGYYSFSYWCLLSVILIVLMKWSNGHFCQLNRVINKNSITGFGTSCKTAYSKMLPSNQTYSFKDEAPHCCLQQILEWASTILNTFWILMTLHFSLNW